MKISPKIQNQLSQFEQVRQQLQLLTTQRIQVESQVRELDNAIKELEVTSKDSTIYKRVGSLFIKVDNKKNLQKDLNEQKETFELRMKTLERQEKQLKERYNDLQKEISKAIQKPE